MAESGASSRDRRTSEEEHFIDVRRAAALVGRHPETVRRWVWSGRLAARRRGKLLLVARAEVEAVGRQGRAQPTLAEWAALARAAREATKKERPGGSAADLVIEDRALRTDMPGSRAGR